MRVRAFRVVVPTLWDLLFRIPVCLTPARSESYPEHASGYDSAAKLVRKIGHIAQVYLRADK